MTEEIRTSRRIVFHGLGALGVAAMLAGCGGDDDGSSSNDTTPSDTTPTKTTPTGSETPTGDGGSDVLATTDEIPVGGGIVLTDQKIVITQPTAGEFLAFSAVCRHQGFTVGGVEDGTITCFVHGSTYDAATGERTGGPAPEGSALPAVEITVKGKDIVAA